MIIAEFQRVTESQFLKDEESLLNLKGNYDNVTIPKRATKGSAGYDFYCPFDIEIKPNELVKIPTGIRCKIDDGYVLNIYPRSSLGFKYQLCLANTVGIIDSDYYGADNEGHIIIALVNRGDKPVLIKAHDRFAQGVFIKYYLAKEDDVDTVRKGGFGSSN